MPILWFLLVCSLLAGCDRADSPQSGSASGGGPAGTLDGALVKKGPGASEAMEKVLQQAEEMPASTLYLSSAVALKGDRLEDSAFLFYAAQLRARFDKECFPPKGTGGDSPMLLYNALSAEIGGSVNPAIMREPQTFAKAVDRVRAFSPKAPAGYNPGYEFTQRVDEEVAREATRGSRDEFVDGMSGMSTLLNDADYFAAFQVVQGYHLGPADKRPSEAKRDEALQTMQRIETEKGIKGFAGMRR